MKNIILANGLAAQGRKTHSFVMYDGLMRRFFDMEQNYMKGATLEKNPEQFFRPDAISKTRFYRKYHITRADILTIMLLQASCYAGTHTVLNVSRRTLYKQLELLFEQHKDESGKNRAPVSYQHFCIALAKLEANGLITVTQRENGNWDIQLLHIEGKGRRFVVFHPAFLSTRFTKKSVGAMKLGILVTMQTGGNRRSWFERILRKEKKGKEKSRMFGPLEQFLHVTASAEIKRIVQEWMDEPFYDKEYLLQLSPEQNSFFQKSGRSYYKFTCKLNPAFIISSNLRDTSEEETARKAAPYHYVMEQKVRYFKQTSFLRFYIQQQKVADFLGEKTEAFQTLLEMLRLHGKDVIRHVIYTLTEYIADNRNIPMDLKAFVDAAILGKKQAKAAQIIREYKLQYYVTEGARPNTYEYMMRWNAFTRKIVQIVPNLTQLRKLVKQASLFLDNKGNRLFFLRREYNACDIAVCALYDMDGFFTNMRDNAYLRQIDPVAYRELEVEMLSAMKAGFKEDSLQGTMLEQLDRLDRMTFEYWENHTLEDLLASFHHAGLAV